MRKTFLAPLLALSIITGVSYAQKTVKPATVQGIARPKLVVGIVVDQMRWDYLYRFYDLYKTGGGFKRLLGEGFSCDNTFVPYLPTVTACGHACIYTGTTPAINGITGNNWWDNNLQRVVYCTDDKNVFTVGSNNESAGQMSPANVLATTITDELKLASNFHSKVWGISIKDRGAIIPAGHAANGAFWYDSKTGNFITSTYYSKSLPAWMQQFNQRKLVDSFYEKNWTLALDKSVYEQYCDSDENSYEARPFGDNARQMPYTLQSYKGKDYGKIASTPFGNDLLLELAKATIAGEQMGKGNNTDFLAVSFSSTDYVGHAFGTHSWELLDTYVRLDETLGKLFSYLDKTVGKDQYTVFLSADHAAPHIPAFLQKNRLLSASWDDGEIKKDLTDFSKQQFNGLNLVRFVTEYDVYLDHTLMDSAKFDASNVKKAFIQYLLKKDQVYQVIDKPHAATATVPAKLREMIINGYNPQRSGDLQVIGKPGIMDGGKTGLSHGVWNAYDAHIPLVWYGWGIKKGSTSRETYMTDIAVTLAALLHIQMPSGSIGKLIEEVIK